MKRRALSTVIGMVFFAAIMITALSYVTYSMDVMGNFSEQIITDEKRQNAKSEEKFEISDVTIIGTKLDAVISNTGQIPVEIKTLWIGEQNAPDTIKKLSVKKAIAPGDSINLIGSIDYDIDPTKGYDIKIVSSRGNAEVGIINAVGQASLYVETRTLPKVITNNFDVTILMTVTNNSTGNKTILNLTPDDPVIDLSTCSPSCSVTYVSGPTPPYYTKLAQGETVHFSWIYTVNGINANKIKFTTPLHNAANTNSTTFVEIRDVPSAVSAGTALESFGLNDPPGSDDVMYLHQENYFTPSSRYQMATSTPDTTGKYIDLSTEIPHFVTMNETSSDIIIPEGTWTGALKILHEYLPDSLIGTGNEQVDMIFHFNDNADIEADSSGNTSGLNRCNSPDNPAYISTGGPDNSPYYSFDGTNDCIDSNFDENSSYDVYSDIESSPDTTALWFRSSGQADNNRDIMIRFDGDCTGYTCDFYQISLGDGTSTNKNKVVFEFDTNSGGTRVKCVSPSTYNNNQWHHIVAVREGSRNCILYVDGAVVNDPSQVGGTGNDVDTGNTPAKFHIGYNGAGEYFKGDLDQIFHWNDRALSSSDVTELYNTKYGDTASIVDFEIYETDYNGNNIGSAIFSKPDYPIPFKDTKDLSTTSDYNSKDSIFKDFNVTSSLNAVTIEQDNRLNFTINYKSGLDTIMRIDDNSMTNPRSSFVQMPKPDPAFPSYYTFDNDDTLKVLAVNAGDTGVWFVYQGTRATFDDMYSNTSYAAIICSVNSTATNKCDTGGANDNWKMDEDRDSILIRGGEVGIMYFWQPQDRPDRNFAGGTVIPAGTYDLNVFIQGYDETGTSFLRKISIGKIRVVD